MRDAVVGDYIFYQRSDLEPRGVGVGDNYKSAFARKLFQKALFFAVVENTEAVRRYDKSVDDRGQADFIVLRQSLRDFIVCKGDKAFVSERVHYRSA